MQEHCLSPLVPLQVDNGKSARRSTPGIHALFLRSAKPKFARQPVASPDAHSRHIPPRDHPLHKPAVAVLSVLKAAALGQWVDIINSHSPL